VAPLRSKLRSNYSKGDGYYILGDGGEASNFMDNNGWSNDNPLDFRRANWSTANNALLMGPTLDETVNAKPSGLPHDIYSYLSSNFYPFCFDGIFPTTVDYPLLVTSPSNLPTLEQFLEAGSDGSQSSLSSPSSTYSTLYTTDFNDDVSQEPLLYTLM
jgi:hypothetical protein